MTLALEALENVISYGSLTGDDFVFDQVDEATTSLRQAIADAEKQEPVPWEQFYPDMGKPQIAFNAEVVGYVAPQQEAKDEPVAWYLQGLNQRGVSLKKETQEWKPLYTTPQSTWVGLTDEEKAQFVVAYYPSNWDRKTAVSLMSDYEKYLKEKNHV